MKTIIHCIICGKEVETKSPNRRKTCGGACAKENIRRITLKINKRIQSTQKYQTDRRKYYRAITILKTRHIKEYNEILRKLGDKCEKQ